MNENEILRLWPSWYTVGQCAIASDRDVDLRCFESGSAVSLDKKRDDELKEMRRHMSEMQTEINDLRATNQVLVKSFRDLIKKMEMMIQEKNNKE